MTDWTRTYTIDLTGNQDGWFWKLYKVGGRVFVDDGEADTLEQASASARTRAIVDHREDEP